MSIERKWLVFTLLGAGGVALAALPSAAADKGASASAGSGNASVSAGGFALPDGITNKNLNDDHDIRKAFGDLVTAATKADGYEDLVDRFVDQDRTRLGQFKEKDGDNLNQIVSKFRSEWKLKYGKEFDFSDDQKVKAFGGVAILTGEIQTPGKLVGNWPIKQPESLTVGAKGVNLEDKAQAAASRQDIKEAKDKFFGGDVNLDKGRDVAVAKLVADAGLPEVHCSLIDEHTGGWRFDIPNNITGQQLHDNLVKHFTALVNQNDQWPSDSGKAYGILAHHVVEAIYGIDTASSRSSS